MRYGLVAALAGMALAGCTNIAQMNGFSTEPAGPRAAACMVTMAGPAITRDAYMDTPPMHMTTSTDGWCGWSVRLVDNQGAVYDWKAASVALAPSHGEARARLDGPLVYIEYRPAPGYSGTDAFAVRLNPGFAVRRASVSVVPQASRASAPDMVVTSTIWLAGPRFQPNG
jgi:hypothetical protein